MRIGFLGSVTLLLAAAAMAPAQEPANPPAATAPVAPATAPVACPDTVGESIDCRPSLPAPGRVYLGADYLFWFTRPTRLPPLVVEGSAQNPGEIPAAGLPDTTIVIGGGQTDAAARSGLRVRAGGWLNAEETIGLEGSAFYLQPIDSTFLASSSTRALGISFRDNVNISLPPETSFIIGAQDQASGSSVVHTSTRFWGAELNALCHVTGGSWYRADAIFGFRYLQLREDLSMSSTSAAAPEVGSVLFQGNSFFDPASITIADEFRTRNDFYGGQVGAHILAQHGIWFADFRATVAAGVTREVVNINGSTSLTTSDGTVTVPGGLFAQATNIGSHSNTQFTLVPAGDVSVGCELFGFLRLSLGYSAIYWSQGVFRPATELDRTVSSTAIPAQNPTSEGSRPIPQLQRQDFWGQGIHFGAELTF
jgi:hypothetical protein